MAKRQLLLAAGAVLCTLCLVMTARAQEASLDQTVRLIRNAEKSVADPLGWAIDLLDVLQLHNLQRSKENICAVIAVIDQESNFVADPVVQGLGRLSEKALREKLDRIPIAGRVALVWLEKNPSPETSFLSRIRSAQTERDLDLAYRALVAHASEKSSLDFIVRAGVFNKLIEERNEIDTAGSMQVSIRFALEMARKRRWLPMTLDDVYAVRDQLYTRHGGMFYGVPQLLAYDSGYDRKIYRFADFNAGRYASRNAALQQVAAKLSGEALALDGDLLSYSKAGTVLPAVTATEAAIRKAASRHKLALSDKQVRDDLLREKDPGFVTTATFLALRDAYRRSIGKTPPFAVVPEIKLASPKIRRQMTTRLFAEAVAKRYQSCMAVK